VPAGESFSSTLVANHEYAGNVDEGQLSFPVGATIVAKQGQEENVWWFGSLCGSSRGGWFLPSSCVPETAFDHQIQLLNNANKLPLYHHHQVAVSHSVQHQVPESYIDNHPRNHQQQGQQQQTQNSLQYSLFHPEEKQEKEVEKLNSEEHQHFHHLNISVSTMSPTVCETRT
jgi:hypothetical protein